MYKIKKLQGYIEQHKNILEKEMITHSSILAWRIPLDRGAWLATVRGVAESQTEQLSIEAGIILTHMRKVQRGFVVLETA